MKNLPQPSILVCSNLGYSHALAIVITTVEPIIISVRFHIVRRVVMTHHRPTPRRALCLSEADLQNHHQHCLSAPLYFQRFHFGNVDTDTRQAACYPKTPMKIKPVSKLMIFSPLWLDTAPYNFNRHYSKTYNYLDALKRRGYNPRQRRWGRCSLTNCPHIFGFYYKVCAYRSVKRSVNQSAMKATMVDINTNR